MKSDNDGIFWFNAIVPVPYPIPHDGPVGQLLKKLKRHPYRPSHMHFMFEKPGYDNLITYVIPLLLSSTFKKTNQTTVPSTSAATHTKPPTPSSVSKSLYSLT